jgi:hypothetical protein
MKKLAYISTTPMTEAMKHLAASRLNMELVPVMGIGPFSQAEEAVKKLNDFDKECRAVALDDPSLVKDFSTGTTKFAIAMFKTENTAGEGEPEYIEVTGLRYYTRDGDALDMQ